MENMSKQEYMKPAMRVLEIQNQCQILSVSGVHSIDGNADMHYGGGGSGPARARQRDIWDDDWSE